MGLLCGIRWEVKNYILAISFDRSKFVKRLEN